MIGSRNEHRLRNLNVLLDNKDPNDALERLNSFERLYAQPYWQQFFADPHHEIYKHKFDVAYAKCIQLATEELIIVDRFVVCQLKKIHSLNTEENAEISHTNLIAAFNNLANFVANEVLNALNVEMRTLILKRFIIMMQLLLEKKDFHGAAAINTGLSKTSVTTFKTSFIQLDETHLKILHEVNEKFLHDQGWKVMLHEIDHKHIIIPNFAAITKRATRAKEALETHRMEKKYLTTSGKQISQNNIIVDKSTNASETNQLLKFEAVIIQQNILNIIPYEKMNTVQKNLIPVKYSQGKNSIILTTEHDEQHEYLTALELERHYIPEEITKLQTRLTVLLEILKQEKMAKNSECSYHIDAITNACNLTSSLTPSEKLERVNELLNKIESSNKGNFLVTLFSNSKKSYPDVNTIILIKNIIINIDQLSAKLNRINNASSGSTIRMHSQPALMHNLTISTNSSPCAHSAKPSKHINDASKNKPTHIETAQTLQSARLSTDKKHRRRSLHAATSSTLKTHSDSSDLSSTASRSSKRLSTGSLSSSSLSASISETSLSNEKELKVSHRHTIPVPALPLPPAEQARVGRTNSMKPLLELRKLTDPTARPPSVEKVNSVRRARADSLNSPHKRSESPRATGSNIVGPDKKSSPVRHASLRPLVNGDKIPAPTLPKPTPARQLSLLLIQPKQRSGDKGSPTSGNNALSSRPGRTSSPRK